MCFPVLTIVKMCTLRKPVIGRPSWKLIKKRYCSSWHARCGFTILSVHWDIGTERASRLVRIPNLWESQMVKVLREKVFFAGKSVLCELWRIFRFQPVLEQYQRCLLYCAFLKLDCYMRINFSTNVGSARCEGKVDWSCSVLRAKPWQETPHFSKLSQRFRGGEVQNVHNLKSVIFTGPPPKSFMYRQFNLGLVRCIWDDLRQRRFT